MVEIVGRKTLIAALAASAWISCAGAVYVGEGDAADYVGKTVRNIEYPKTTGKYVTNEDLYGRFELGDIGGIIDIPDGGYDEGMPKKPLAYVWAAGFYVDEIDYGNEFAAWAYAHKDRAILNEKPLHVNGGADEYYYDMCDPETMKKRVEYLIDEARNKKVSGYFFDWGNAAHLREPEFRKVKRDFERRHPGTDYAECLRDFYEKLKENGLTIVSNQAYRDEIVDSAIDYDMTESYITEIRDEGSGSSWTMYQDPDEIMEYFDYLSGIKARYGVDFVYMNYAAPKRVDGKEKTPVETIEYVYAMSKIGGFIPYTEVPENHKLENPMAYLYEIDLGKPVGERELENGIIWREYENGIVMATYNPVTEREFVKIGDLPKGISIYDVTDKRLVPVVNGEATVSFEPYYDENVGEYRPIGKILVFVKDSDKSSQEDILQVKNSDKGGSFPKMNEEGNETVAASENERKTNVEETENRRNAIAEIPDIEKTISLYLRFYKTVGRGYLRKLAKKISSESDLRSALRKAETVRGRRLLGRLFKTADSVDFPIAGYFLNIGSDKFDWLYATGDSVYKLDGVDEETGNFKYTNVDDEIGLREIGKGIFEIERAEGRFSGLRGRITGLPFINYGDRAENGFDWAIVVRNSVYKLEGYNPYEHSFVYTRVPVRGVSVRDGRVFLSTISEKPLPGASW